MLTQPSNTIAIADLGCSVCPNTFFAMQTIIQTLQQKHHHHHFEFQVFFNDQTSNDFNTLLASLPDPRPYFAAAATGSFYGRLFPSSSLHVAFSSSSLHWLSRAYADQFEEDMGVFLRARAEEIVEGGIVIVIMPGVDDGVVTHDVGIAITFLGCILMDMVKEGMLSQDKVDTLNVPHVYPSVKQMRKAMEKNGWFRNGNKERKVRPGSPN
ncbi:hypothetical protein SASPL_129750 [Salvia splendens]|uniref:Jasmonate O-methyltransferase n=1 Tax=Salvia splendens TaxID=180675 RepID=A0A8X8XDA5_SALSN|nr:hypothetical protein SASPL_129750 [Salvia splendens]